MRIYIIVILFLAISVKSYSQITNYKIIKINSNINSIFKGDGFDFGSIEFEYGINRHHSLGLWVGGNFKSSKLELLDVEQISSINNNSQLKVGTDYYYYVYVNEKGSGVFVSPGLYYIKEINSKEKTKGYGMKMDLGYRFVINKFAIGVAFDYNYEYLKQTTEDYNYYCKEFKPININLSIGYNF